jgi:hypothetical protein
MYEHPGNIKDNEQSETSEQIQQPVDAVIQVETTHDLLEAYLIITTPLYGGEEPSLSKIKREIANKRIVYGIDNDKLNQISVKPVIIKGL